MITQLRGILLEKQPPQIVVLVDGVGYEVDVPMSSFYHLPMDGEPIQLFIHFAVREDAQLLYGFLTRDERDTFRQLIKVSGIGARTALAILSGMSADELAAAIATDDLVRLSRVPGIGKKTAERLVLELRGKLIGTNSPTLSHAQGLPLLAKPDDKADILNALLGLGYSDKEANAVLKTLPADIGLNDGIRQALKALAR